MKLEFEIRLTSDYHIASGYGLGVAVDSALQRDADGIPVIRGTTLVGLLRDGLLRLLSGTESLRVHFAQHPQAVSGDKSFDAATAYCAGENRCPLCDLLGTPAHPKPWIFSSARPVGDEQPMLHAQSGFGHPVTRIKIDPKRRRALDKHLFVQEEGNKDLIFNFAASRDGGGERIEREAAMLVAAARSVRRLGGARRRGRGECLWTLSAVDGDGSNDVQGRFLTLFEEHWLRGGIGGDDSEAAPVAFVPPSGGTGGERRFRVVLRSDEPIVVAERPGSGNLFRGLDHIPGAALWGAVSARMAKRLGFDPRRKRSQGSAGHDAFVDLFLRGGLHFSPLYPARIGRGGGTLGPRFPAPLDLLTCKHYPGFADENAKIGDEVHHAAGYGTRERVLEECPVVGCNGPLEAPRGLLPLEFGRGLEPVGPALQEEMHPRIDPASQRVNTGDLYGYEALASGQFFIGELWCRDRDAWETLRCNTGIEEGRGMSMHLGKALRRGYGSVSLVLESADDLPAFASGVALSRRVLAPNGDSDGLTLSLLLVSDLILIDPWGRAIESLTKQCGGTGNATGTPLVDELQHELFDGLAIDVNAIRGFSKAAIIDGFSGHLGLPRWRDSAIRAGSAVGIKVVPRANAPADWFGALLARLERLETQGIGLRREEGFGRLVFNHPVYDNYRDQQPRLVRTPQVLLLQDGLANGVGADERRLLDWGDRIDQVLADSRAFNDTEWIAVARWINAWSDMGIASTCRQFTSLGEDNILHGNREGKGNRFDSEWEGGLETIGVLLAEVQDLDAGRHMEPALLRLLAGRLAAATGAKVTEKKTQETTS